MQSTALAENRVRSSPVSGLRLEAILLLAGLAILWFILCRQLSYEWAANEQYSYGWFVPFFAAFLFWLRWEEWRAAEDQRSAVAQLEARPGFRMSGESLLTGSAFQSFRFSAFVMFLLFLFFPVRLFEVANPDWRPLSWIHALVVVSLTLVAIRFWGGKSAVRHFAFPVCFILVAVPWLTPIEAPLVQGLMRLVASVATETLTLLGIPAQLEGSLIRVSSGVVGVSEACSGVRSLQTSLMIGLLFGELKRLTIVRRFALVGAALAIALLANFARAFFLVWIAATKNLAAVEGWHDLAGYAIVGVVFLGTVAVAAGLGRTSHTAHAIPGAPPASSAVRQNLASSRWRHARPYTFALLTLLYLLLVEAGVEGWYRWHERALVPAPRWTVKWPQQSPGLHELKIDEHTLDMLRFDAGREVSWSVKPQGEDGFAPGSLAEHSAVAFLYFFRWEPGTATVLRARAHRPDICLPATGWRQVGAPGYRSYAVSDNFALPFRLFRFQRESGDGRMIYADAFFCLREDRVRAEDAGKAVTPSSDWSIGDRWMAVRSGLRNPGQQVLEFALVGRRGRSKMELEADFAKLVPELVRTSAVKHAQRRPVFEN